MGYCWASQAEVGLCLAKELFAGFAGAAVDRLVETKGADAWSAHQRQRAQAHAQEQIQETFTEEVYEQNY
jgi:hypothetical protein